jgi:hypothetical protein
MRACDTQSMVRRPHRPRDFAQLAKLVVDMATGEAPRDPEPGQGGPTATCGVEPDRGNHAADPTPLRGWTPD